MLAPFEGPLSLAEAYDFIDAYVLAPIGTAPISAVRKAQLRDVGEIRFRALRSAIANENYIVPTLGPRLEPTAYSALAGCEGEAIETLKPLAKSTGTGFVFNGSYTWSRVPREGGRYCVLIMQPFERGLSVDEARDFLFATTIVQKNDQDNNDVPRESLLQQSDSGAGTRATSGMPTKLTEAVTCSPFSGPV